MEVKFEVVLKTQRVYFDDTQGFTPYHPCRDLERFLSLASRKDNADERLDLPQVDLMNFRVEYVTPRSGRCLGREDDNFPESLTAKDQTT